MPGLVLSIREHHGRIITHLSGIVSRRGHALAISLTHVLTFVLEPLRESMAN